MAKRFETGKQEIREAGKRDNLSRKISLYLLRRLTDISNEDIAGHFGIGYTAVSQAALRLKKEIKKDKGLKKIIQKTEEELLSED